MVAVAAPWLVETSFAQRLIAGQLERRGLSAKWERLTVSVRAAHLELTGLEASVNGARSTVSSLALDWSWRAAFSGVLQLHGLTVGEATVHIDGTTAPPAPGDPAPPRWSALLDPLDALPPVHLDSIVVRRLAVHHPLGSVEEAAVEGAFHAGRGVEPDGFVVAKGGDVRWTRQGAPQQLTLDAQARATLKRRTVTFEASANLVKASPPLPVPLTQLVDLTGQLELDDAQHRALITLARATLVGGGGTATARLALMDGAQLPVVEAATAKADFVTLLPFVRLFEPELTLDEGRLDLTAQMDGSMTPPLEGTLLLRGLSAPQGNLARGSGTVRVEPSSRRLETHLAFDGLWLRRGARSLSLKTMAIDADAVVSGSTAALRVTLPVQGLELTVGDLRLGARSLTARARTEALPLDALFPFTTTFTLDGAELRAPGAALATVALSGQLTLTDPTHGALRLEAPISGFEAPPVSMQSATMRLEVPTFHLDPVAPGRSSASVRLAAQATSLKATRDGTKVALEQVDVELSGALAAETLQTLKATITSAPLTLSIGAQRSVLAGGTLTLVGDDVRADAVRVQVDGQCLGLDVHTAVERARGRLEVTGAIRAVDHAPLLTFAAPFLPDGIALDLSKSSLRVDGRVSHHGDVMTDDLHLRLERPAATVSGHVVGAHALDVHLKHRGGGGVQRLTGTVTFDRARVASETLQGPLRLDLDGLLDRPRGLGALNARVFALDDEELAVNLDFERAKTGAVSHRLSMDAGHLGALLPLLRAWRGAAPEVDLAALGVHLESRGTTTGLLDEALMPDPEWEAHVDSGQHVALVLTNVVHRTEGETVKLPRLEFVLDAGVHHGAVHLETNVDAPSLEIDLGRQHATLTGLHQRLIADSDEFPTHGELRLAFSGSLDTLTQNVWPPWAPEAVQLEGAARLDRLSALSVDRFLLESEPAGTRLTLTKRLRTADPLPGRVTNEAVFVTGGQRFVVDGALTQRLDRLDGDPMLFRGGGTVTAPFIIDSADRQLFRVRGRLELDRATAIFPAQRLEVHDASGVATLEEALALDPIDGLELVPSSDQRVFARARYQDLQPFLSSDAVITARRVRVLDFELSPVVTSLEVEHNRFSLNKLKAQRGRALLSGQVFLDYQRGNRALTFRGGITGLERAGAAVPLDANAALSLSLERLEIDGRVQVVRASREHVIDLVDVLDPYREIGPLNRLRSALRWGYPRQVRLDFHDGLLAMDVELGGLGGLFDLGALRGLALGPFITRYLAPFLTDKESR
ncbi:MAG: hypothetical protein SFW67_05475 [Myxococcaceae bacterium]|nr:hypothetical protein [Myxococcaceae bacterium]